MARTISDNSHTTFSVIEVRGNTAPAIQWCIKTFGQPGPCRWFMINYCFYFVNERDAFMFELMWINDVETS